MDAPVGLATGAKISLIALAPSRVCLNKLSQAQHLDYAQAAPKNEGRTCGWTIAANMTGAGGSKFRPHTVTAQCQVVLASYIWLLEVDGHAQKYLGSGLKKTHHTGTYSCRRQRGNASGTWSQHAFANAWDITGFELEDGQVISITKHWRSDGSKVAKARSKFLKKSRASACKLFNVVLTPDFNAAHKDHFHLDQGPNSSCH